MCTVTWHKNLPHCANTSKSKDRKKYSSFFSLSIFYTPQRAANHGTDKSSTHYYSTSINDPTNYYVDLVIHYDPSNHDIIGYIYHELSNGGDINLFHEPTYNVQY